MSDNGDELPWIQFSKDRKAVANYKILSPLNDESIDKELLHFELKTAINDYLVDENKEKLSPDAVLTIFCYRWFIYYVFPECFKLNL